MMLSSFGYKEPGWELTMLSPLCSTNLLVGKNATGKTRTVRAILNAISFMQMRESVLGVKTFEADFQFVDDSDAELKLGYSFKIVNGIVEKESLILNGDSRIKRTKTQTKFLGEKINPPADKLVVQVRRDENQYPVVEKLMKWVEGITCVFCSDINPLTIMGQLKSTNPYSFSELVELLSPDDKANVIRLAHSLGYDITELKTVKASSDLKLVQLKEKNITNRMVDMQLSNGMLRTLYLLCFISVIKQSKKLTMLLIDDLGEGLDYHRSVALGKVIFEDCEEHGLQLIASSNDAFLMDVVDISKWQVLRRKNGKVSSINQNNNRDLFRSFRMTGLSNFDLFSSDFVDQYLSSK